MIATEQQKEELYRAFHGKVLGYLRSRLRDPDTAEDLASDVFLKVFQKLDGFDEKKASLSTWIYAITRNTLTDFFRTRRVVEEIPETFSDNFSVEDEVCNAETLSVLAGALKQLGKRERDVIILRFYSGKTLKEIAERMNISYAYVKVLQNKAFAELKKHFV